MDHHHHHHHQQQWRPMPIPGNICPTCSNSHFPFCPPFNQIQNPRPPFDPHLLPAGPPRPPWHRNPSLDREPYNQFQLQQSYSNGFTNEYDRNSKRPRVDDMQSNNQNSVGVSSDIERRLKLIRDHGSSLGGPMLGMNNHETNRYVQESLGFDGSYGKFDGSWESRSELGPMGVRNLEMNNFHDPRFGPGDRVGQPYMQSNRNGFLNEEEFVHSSRYGINNVDQAPPPPPPPHISQRVPPYPGSEVPNDHYHNTHNPQWRQVSDSVPESELRYSHMNNWHGPSVMYPEQRGSVAMDNCGPKNQQQQQPYGMQYPVDTRQPLDVGFQSKDGNRGPIRHHSMPGVTQHGASNLNERGGYFQSPSGGSMVFENTGQTEATRFYSGQPPIPASPPPPLPFDPTFRPSSELKAYSSPPKTTASLFPVAVSSSAMVPTSYQPIPKAHSLSPPPYYHNKPLMHASTGFFSEAVGDGQPFSLKQLSSDKPKVIDASHLFKRPHRATRPDHIVIILRGLPGSGKSYLAKMLRDLEVENGGHAPRIHSMDDYFMTEVEKIEEGDASKSSVRGKKPIMKMVMEYCYEPEMEEAYRSSMLKAFKKTLEEGGFTFIIVDDRNLRVADFAQFWAIGKSSGYEVYILEATYKDPAGCAARNVHGFTQDDVEKMARQWEEAPSLYLQLDVKTLFHGDDLKESGIQEVEMDMEDEDVDGNLSGLQERMPENNIVPPLGEDTPDDSSKDGNRWDSEGDHLTEEVKELGRSKWSDDLDEEDTERTERVKGNVNALSGLIQAYGKGAKSVRWADKVGNTGFSLHATKKADVSSLVIGPGTGYNLKSNPLREETPAPSSGAGESKRQSIFQERLRAERESFKLVFDRRRQRIGLGLEEE